MRPAISKDVGRFMKGVHQLQQSSSFYRFHTVTVVPALAFLLCLCMVPPLQGAARSVHGNQNRAVSVVNRFFTIVSGLEGEGVPDSTAIESLAPYISNDFLVLLHGGWKKEEQYQKDSHEPIPPLIEGSLFCSLFEGFTAIRSITPDSMCANCLYVAFQYDHGRRNQTNSSNRAFQPVSWTDRVIIIEENGRTVIDDIELLNKASFSLRGSVKEILKNLKAE